MQNEINDLFNSLAPQTLGMTDPVSSFGLAMLVPGVIVFAIIYIGRQMFRPRWRGYWDAV